MHSLAPSVFLTVKYKYDTMSFDYRRSKGKRVIVHVKMLKTFFFQAFLPSGENRLTSLASGDYNTFQYVLKFELFL
jgi:hypothetical protein